MFAFRVRPGSRIKGGLWGARRRSDGRAEDADTVRLKRVFLVVNSDNNITDSHPIVEARSLRGGRIGDRRWRRTALQNFNDLPFLASQ
jgi:hypothetical protein